MERIELIYRSSLELIKQLEVLYNNALIKAPKESHLKPRALLQRQSETLRSLIQEIKIFQKAFIQGLQNIDVLISEDMRRSLKYHHLEQQYSAYLAESLKELDVTESVLSDFFKGDTQLRCKIQRKYKTFVILSYSIFLSLWLKALLQTGRL